MLFANVNMGMVQRLLSLFLEMLYGLERMENLYSVLLLLWRDEMGKCTLTFLAICVCVGLEARVRFKIL